MSKEMLHIIFFWIHKGSAAMTAKKKFNNGEDVKKTFNDIELEMGNNPRNFR